MAGASDTSKVDERPDLRPGYRLAGHATLNRWFEIGVGASTRSAFVDTASVS